jgi:hypothetical protein
MGNGLVALTQKAASHLGWRWARRLCVVPGVVFLVGCGAQSGPSPVIGGATGTPGLHTSTSVTGSAMGTQQVSNAGPPTPIPVISPDSSGTASVSEPDSNARVTIRVGQHVRVELSTATSGDLHYVWSSPVSSDPSVLASTGASSESDGAQQAAFQGLRPGSAMIASTGEPACSYACAPSAFAWHVSVTVEMP